MGYRTDVESEAERVFAGDDAGAPWRREGREGLEGVCAESWPRSGLTLCDPGMVFRPLCTVVRTISRMDRGEESSRASEAAPTVAP